MRAADLGGVPGHGEPDDEKGGSDLPSSNEGEAGLSITLPCYTTGSSRFLAVAHGLTTLPPPIGLWARPGAGALRRSDLSVQGPALTHGAGHRHCKGAPTGGEAFSERCSASTAFSVQAKVAKEAFSGRKTTQRRSLQITASGSLNQVPAPPEGCRSLRPPRAAWSVTSVARQTNERGNCCFIAETISPMRTGQVFWVASFMR